jgi:hypothetical protein
MGSAAGGSAFDGLRLLPALRDGAPVPSIGKAPELESDDPGTNPFSLRLSMRNNRCKVLLRIKQ